MKRLQKLLMAIVIIIVNTQCNNIATAKNEVDDGVEDYINKDYAGAYKLLTKNSTTKDFEHNPQASYVLGNMYYLGEGGASKNYVEASKWYNKAAANGNVEAMHNIAVIYQDGGSGVTANFEEALKWYHKAAEKGFVSSQLNLGIIYQNGEKVKQDFAEALKWYNKAAEQNSAAAQYDLATMYANGNGVEKNEKEALRYLRLAAEQGMPEAKELLKKMGVAE